MVTNFTIVIVVITNVGLWFTNVVCELQILTLYMQWSCEFSDWISKNIFWTRYIDISMSNPAATPVMPPYNQFQNFYPPGVNPYSLDPAQILSSLQNSALTSNINEGANKTIFAVSDAQRQLTSELNGVVKDINDSTSKIVGTVETHSLGLRDAIERGNVGQSTAIERINTQLGNAIERNGSSIMSATERVGGQVGGAIERNGGSILTAIEKVAGEGRLTTTIVDAASRQAANDSARDILAAVERNGGASVGASKDSYNGLLASIERNSGENRMTTITADGASQARLADVRRDITANLIGMEGELLAAVNKSHSDLITNVGNTAWETRQNQNNHFATLLSETQKNSSSIALQTAQNYASLLMESQKSSHVADSKADAHYASQMLEAQKIAHLLDNKSDAHFAAMLSKTDTQYASIMLEQQKVKECLAAQAANNFAINQLEQQKIKEVITIQLQDAKYEALKNKQDLSKEMAECCCEVKQKIDQRTQDVINTVDTLDRNRLRDEVNTINNENTILRLLDDDWGRGRRHRHRRSRSRSRSSDRGSRR